MEMGFWRLAVGLGVPGLALGVFFALFRAFKWDFPQVPVVWVGPLIVIFMVLTTAVVLYALTLWRPVSGDDTDEISQDTSSGDDDPGDGVTVRLKVFDEEIAFTELLRSEPNDVVKVHTSAHLLGIAAENQWISNRYPQSKRLNKVSPHWSSSPVEKMKNLIPSTSM